VRRMNQRFAGVPGSAAWREITRVKKGWSEDEKYYILTDDGPLLLRWGPSRTLARKLREYQAVGSFYAGGVPVGQPLHAGLCGENAYILYRWVAGRDAADVLPNLPEADQYAYGLRAGQALRAIHALPADGGGDWAARYNRKIDAKLRDYGDCALQLPGAQRYLSYIADSRPLLQGRPQTFQHGDYHIGNMLLDDHGDLRVIDFNRLDTGDPWEEFNRITWCAAASPAFASGRIDGYFDGAAPQRFFALLALYIAVNQVASLPWAYAYGPQEVQVMLAQSQNVLGWYGNFTTVVPAWYAPR
ncbi:MAG: phosphotransferase, partial [Eubacteriales bacterium]|nr:phosphotransferase [Eubacteriales bacterium]